MSLPRRPLPLLAAILLLSCTPPDPWKIVSKMDLDAPSGEPKITGVTDLGSVPLIMNKPLRRAEADGVAVVGELLVIRGKNLGRQPTVSFGTKPMAVLARTADGGIVVRAPHASTPGDQRILLTNDRGSSSFPMTLKRYGLAVVPGLPGIQVLDVTVQGVKPVGQPLLATAPGHLALHKDGSVAYASTGGRSPSLLVIDLAAAGGPKVIAQRKLGQWKVLGLAVASEAKRLVAVHEKAMVIFDLDDPRDPLRFNPARFPPGVVKAGVADLQLSPDGKTLAVLVEQGNALVLFDISDPNQVRNTTFLPLLPDAKETLVRGLHFTYEPTSEHKQVLWVATGDTVASQKVGKHPPKLLKYGITSAVDRTVLPSLKALGQVELPSTHTPLDVASSYAVSEIVSASVIRREPGRMTFFASMLHPDLFLLHSQRLDTPTGLQQGAELLRKLGSYGVILRTDALGRGAPFHSAPAVAPSLALTGDGRLLVAVTCQPKVAVDPPKVEIPCGLLVVPTEKGEPKMTPMGQLPLAAFAPPFRFGRILLQP